jgi:hypothetical protein
MDRKLNLLRRSVNSKGVKLRAHGGWAAQIEGFLSRGDRRIGAVIEEAWRRGARFDQWHEYFDPSFWIAAADACGIDIAWYTSRVRSHREALPWDHLFAGVEKDWLWRDWERAQAEIDFEDCRWSPCTDCGTHALGTSADCHDISFGRPMSLPVVAVGSGSTP